jgi:hypothetical protein
MVEVSLVALTLGLEGMLLLLIIVLLGVYFGSKRKNRDRVAAVKLVEQLKKQSQTRLEATGSFLSEKYLFEGDELKKAIKAIDREEKKYFQKLIDVYLKRDAEAFTSMDASLAELIDTYKSLTPAIPEVESTSPEQLQELESLRDLNAKLEEELKVTKKTMGNMIAEFGNMFGGGHEHELAKHEVMEKVKDHPEAELEDKDIEQTGQQSEPEMEGPKVKDDDDDDDDIDIDIGEEDQETESAVTEKNRTAQVMADNDVDGLLNSIDLSDDST